MSPIDQSINIIRQEQQLIPAAVAAFHQTKGANKLLAAHLLQELTGGRSEDLIEPIWQALQAEARINNPIDILSVMAKMMSAPERKLGLQAQVDLVYDMKMAMSRYLSDTGITKYFKPEAESCFRAYKDIPDIAGLLRYFIHWYPTWWQYQQAIKHGFIQSQLETFRWRIYDPKRFKWGKGSLEFRAIQRLLDKWSQELNTKYRIDAMRF